MAKDAVKAEFADDGDDWLDRARAEVLSVLVDAPAGRSALEVRQAVPMNRRESGGDGGLRVVGAPCTHTPRRHHRHRARGQHRPAKPLGRWRGCAPPRLERSHWTCAQSAG